jgi:hypothetical protein
MYLRAITKLTGFGWFLRFHRCPAAAQSSTTSSSLSLTSSMRRITTAGIPRHDYIVRIDDRGVWPRSTRCASPIVKVARILDKIHQSSFFGFRTQPMIIGGSATIMNGIKSSSDKEELQSVADKEDRSTVVS